MREWDEFDVFQPQIDKYMLWRGEGETMASQIVTAINKLVYKYFNDGDVFDNSYHLRGWWNDLTSYANWLDANTDLGWILKEITRCRNESQYEDLLYSLCENGLEEGYLEEMSKVPKVGTIYECEGQFKYVEHYDDEDDDYWD